MTTERARITITDIAYFLLAIVALRTFYPVFSKYLSDNAATMDAGTLLIMQTILPVAIVVLLGLIYLKAGVGAQ